MEQWEIDLRSQLNKELEDGTYRINGLCTGKGGYIEFLISVEKQLRECDKGKGVKQQIEESEYKPTYGKLKLDTLDNLINNIIKNKRNMKEVEILVVNKSDNTLPHYSKMGDAGMDIRAFIIPDKSNIGGNVIIIPPNSRKLIPTGIYVKIAEGYQIEVRPRSGLAFKEGITVLNTPGTIDENYTGEIGVVLYNTTDTAFKVRSGDRIAQLVLMKSPKIKWKDVQELPTTDRGEGGFGSTGV